jgi:hypothetical protein
LGQLLGSRRRRSYSLLDGVGEFEQGINPADDLVLLG